jgi:hypothetical protein
MAWFSTSWTALPCPALSGTGRRMHLSSLLQSPLQQLTLVLHAATYLAALAVALAVVRPRHRTAGSLLAAAACMLLVELFAWRGVAWAVELLGAELAAAYGVAAFVMALWGAAAWALLLLGVVRLAAGAQPEAGADVGG